MGFPSKSSNNKNKLEKVISLSIGTGIPFSSVFAPTSLLPFRGISEPIRQALTGLEERRSNDGWWSKCIEMATNKSDFTYQQLGIEPIKVGICLEIFVWNESWRPGKMDDLWPKNKIICNLRAPV